MITKKLVCFLLPGINNLLNVTVGNMLVIYDNDNKSECHFNDQTVYCTTVLVQQFNVKVYCCTYETT